MARSGAERQQRSLRSCCPELERSRTERSGGRPLRSGGLFLGRAAPGRSLQSAFGRPLRCPHPATELRDQGSGRRQCFRHGGGVAKARFLLFFLAKSVTEREGVRFNWRSAGGRQAVRRWRTFGGGRRLKSRLLTITLL